MASQSWVAYLDAAEWDGLVGDAPDEFNGWSLRREIESVARAAGMSEASFVFDPEAGGTSITTNSEHDLRSLIAALVGSGCVLAGSVEIFAEPAAESDDGESDALCPISIDDHESGTLDGPFEWTEPGVYRGYVYSTARREWAGKDAPALIAAVRGELDRAGLGGQFELVEDGPDGIALDAADRVAFVRAAAALGLVLRGGD